MVWDSFSSFLILLHCNPIVLGAGYLGGYDAYLATEMCFDPSSQQLLSSVVLVTPVKLNDCLKFLVREYSVFFILINTKRALRYVTSIGFEVKSVFVLQTMLLDKFFPSSHSAAIFWSLHCYHIQRVVLIIIMTHFYCFFVHLCCQKTYEVPVLLGQ